MDSLGDWRGKINMVDEKLLSLLNRRAHLARQIGQIKRLSGRRLWSPRRERVVLQRMVRLNPGPLDGNAVGRIFRTIIRESRRAEAAAMARHGRGK